ncbi:hypothetical protein K438DRAFT_1681845 [Mycena galopus ATCC 62051]|nr:hypothetical protein K438DRAFT_1681845 [Mycena galopus ATCC 62051]
MLSYDPAWSAESPFAPFPPGKSKELLIPQTVDVDLLIQTITTCLKSFDPEKEVVFSDVEPVMVGSGVYNVVYKLVSDIPQPEPYIVRIRFNFRANLDAACRNARRIVDMEASLLQFLAMKAPSLASVLPSLLCWDSDPHNAIGAPFMVQKQLPGINLLHASITPGWDHFSWETFVAGYSKALVTVFNIELRGNLMIGVPSMLDRTKIEIGPFRDADTSDEGGPFTHMKDYIKWRIRAKKIEPNENPPIDASVVLQRVLDLAERLCDLINPKLLRLCLVHDDPHDRNCLVNGSEFSGLVDWEAHSILPACLAAEYPPYLRWDGMREDRYAALNEHGDIDYMNRQLRPDKDRAAELCSIFLETARSQNPLYAQALEEGKSMRQLIEWVMFVDWDGDYVWDGLDLWVSDVQERIATN